MNVKAEPKVVTTTDPIELAKAKIAEKQEQETKANPEQGKGIEPLTIKDINALFQGTIPDKETIKELKDAGTDKGKQLDELEKIKEEGKIDYRSVQFADEKIFDKVTTDHEAFNSFMQQFAQYISNDTAEKIAALQKLQKETQTSVSDKLMSDLTTSQIIHDFLSRKENAHLLPVQKYFLYTLGEKRATDENVHDLSQLMKAAKEEVEKTLNYSQQKEAPIAFGGLGGTTVPQATQSATDGSWKSVIHDILKNR